MSITELRAEEDYCKNIGLTICDICEKGKDNECERCQHHYPSLYTPDKVITVIREAKAKETCDAKNNSKNQKG